MSSVAQAAGRNDLVVMLECRADGDPYASKVGAGILVHQSGERAIVVTARHNLPESDRERIFVEPFSAGGKDFPASIIAEDQALDLAVLELREAGISPEAFEAARRILVPEGAEVVFEHGAFAIGNPNRRPWFQNYSPEPILERKVTGERAEIRFESSVADVGMSGGGLFSEHGALLGMVQKLSSAEGGAHALGIETIAGRLEKWKIPFSLEKSPQLLRSASRRVLSDLGLFSAAGLRKVLDEEKLDFGLLHLFWLAGIAPLEVETVLGGQAERSEISIAARVFNRLGPSGSCVLPDGGATGAASRLSAAQRKLVLAGLASVLKDGKAGQTCGAHLRLWIKRLVESGLDPDLIVASEYYPREALLALAMRSKNVSAILALLESGASPHPYQDLAGTEHRQPRFLEPLKFVAEDFVGVDHDVLRRAFDSAGVVVSRSVRDEGTRKAPRTPTLEESETDPICERAAKRYGFDWCGYLRELFPALRYYLGTQECDSSGYCYAELTHTLFISRDRVLLLAEREAFGRVEPVVIDATREPGQWYAYVHDDNYGCKARADGFEPTYCWRGFQAWPASYRSAGAKIEAEQSRSASSASVIDRVNVEGISLSTPLTEALATLESAGYTTRTADGSGDNRNLATTRDYSLRGSGGAREVKVIAINESIRALYFRHFNAGGPPSGFTVPDSGSADFLYYETTEREEHRETLTVERSGIGKSYLLYRRSPDHVGTEIALLRRAEDESAPEHSFFQRWLHEWLGKVDVAAGAQGPCVDRYAHIRGHLVKDCLTPGERASSYLKKVKDGGKIRQLASGLSYEVLAEGQGPKTSPGSRATSYVVFRYLDEAKREDRINNWEVTVGEVEWPDIKEALLNMKQGDKWRLYGPPWLGSNDSPYLQMTEIELTRVSKD